MMFYLSFLFFMLYASYLWPFAAQIVLNTWACPRACWDCRPLARRKGTEGELITVGVWRTKEQHDTTEKQTYIIDIYNAQNLPKYLQSLPKPQINIWILTSLHQTGLFFRFILIFPDLPGCFFPGRDDEARRQAAAWRGLPRHPPWGDDGLRTVREDCGSANKHPRISPSSRPLFRSELLQWPTATRNSESTSGICTVSP